MTSNEQYVIFHVKKELYALTISHIQEIIKMKDICITPTNHRPYLKGVINVRGNVIPVISLHKRFGYTEPSPSRSTRIIIVEINKITVGLIVDHVVKVETLEQFPLPESSDEQMKTHCTGIVYMDTRIVPTLHLPSILEIGAESHE